MKVRRQRIEVVMIDILENLPVSSLVRFRSVSKWWCNLIKSSYFINRHLVKRRENDTVLLVRRTTSTNKELERPDDMLSFHDMHSEELKEVRPKLSLSMLHSKVEYMEFFNGEVYLFGPIDGILCMGCDRRVVFCNPTLREFWETPPCHYTFQEGFYDYVEGHGFGSTYSNDLVVVLIRRVDSRGSPGGSTDVEFRQVVHLYNSRINSWKIIFDDTDFPTMMHNTCSDVFFNGACHWNAFSRKSRIARDSIVSLNVNTEIFTQYEYPEYFMDFLESDHCLMVLKECLSIIWFKEWTIAPLEIWVMKEYGVTESWTKLFEIGPYRAISVISYWKDDEWLLAENMDGQLASFAVHTNAVKAFQIYGNKRSLCALICKESLISIESIIGKAYKT